MTAVKTQLNREWFIFDAKDKILGRLSTEVADILRGKKKVDFDNAVDSGDCVVIINAEKIALTGNKEEAKRYYKHTGYIGNLKTFTVPELRESKPEQILKHAIYGMLPKNTLRDQKIKRLKIYAGTTHPHQNVKFVNQDK